jgi:hypothetical protein
MVISRWTYSQEEINQVIINWYNNEKFFNIYEYYLDSNNWMQGTDARLSNVMFNNRFLNLIQALEDYYREHFEVIRTGADRQLFEEKKENILSQITDSSLKQWLNNTFKFTKFPSLEEKLSTIIDNLSLELSSLFNDTSLNEFPMSATNFRNSLSHGKSKEINQGIRLHEDYFIAQVLLGVCILKTLGIQSIKNRVAYYSKFEDAAYQVSFFQNERRSSTINS